MSWPLTFVSFAQFRAVASIWFNGSADRAFSPPQTGMHASLIKIYLPWVVACALFMEQLDSTIVNTAVPAMAASLRVAPLSLKAVVTSYILSLAVCIPMSGWMADRFGSRRVFAIAVAVFTLSSVLCGLAVNAPMLVAARVVQGVGAAMMMPVGRLAIVRTFPKSELLRAMNFVIIPALIGPLLGPTVGGLIVHWLSWRDIFFVNVPVGLAALLIIDRYMPDYRGEATRPLDLIGLVLFGSGVALLSWLLEIFGEHEIDPTSAGVLLLLSISLFGQVAPTTPVALIIALSLAQGFFNSLQFSAMNSMAYADVESADSSMAATIASSLQQLSLSFGLACGSLITAWYLGERPQTDHAAVTDALHHAFMTLGVVTVLSSLLFRTLHAHDGDSVSRGELREAN